MTVQAYGLLRGELETDLKDWAFTYLEAWIIMIKISENALLQHSQSHTRPLLWAQLPRSSRMLCSTASNVLGSLSSQPQSLPRTGMSPQQEQRRWSRTGRCQLQHCPPNRNPNRRHKRVDQQQNDVSHFMSAFLVSFSQACSLRWQWLTMDSDSAQLWRMIPIIKLSTSDYLAKTPSARPSKKECTLSAPMITALPHSLEWCRCFFFVTKWVVDGVVLIELRRVESFDLGYICFYDSLLLRLDSDSLKTGCFFCPFTPLTWIELALILLSLLPSTSYRSDWGENSAPLLWECLCPFGDYSPSFSQWWCP